jgi:two-component system, NarL family, nitrate/nitrite response regulator NarL
VTLKRKFNVVTVNRGTELTLGFMIKAPPRPVKTTLTQNYPRAVAVPLVSNASNQNVRQGAPSNTPSRQPIRILIADDHPVVRKGLSSCLSQVQQVAIVGEAINGQDALRKAKELTPDLVLMDIDMPLLNGLTAADILRKENPTVKVLILSMHNDSDYVLRILQSGARGYVLKQAPTEELVKAIETIHSGETFFSQDVARLALNQFVRGPGEGPHTGQISAREREVLIAIAEGLSNKEIACRLGVGVRTVETHRERIMRKLNIHSIAGLTRFAISKGLIPLQRDLAARA